MPSKLKIISLGGSGEVGKNMLVFHYTADEAGLEDAIVVVDSGVMFPTEEHPGVDLIIPDITYLLEHRDRVKAICLTHGHEDHIGALPFVLRQLPVPIYGTPLTLGMVREKLTEHGLAAATELHNYPDREPVTFGPISVEAIHVTHTLPDTVSLVLRTPVGTVVHTGDFKIDQTPVDNRICDLARFSEVGEQGVTLLISDSVNAERKGWCPSERTLRPTFEQFMREAEGRFILATFGSNLHRVQMVCDVAANLGRKVAIYGRSMKQNVATARALGYLKIEDSLLVRVEDLSNYAPNEIVILTTGSQGEPLAGLTRMSRDEHSPLRIQPSDTVILSSTPIPGNEDSVWRVVNRICRIGARMIYDHIHNVHVSGHAYQEELKMMITLTRPEFVVPYHGEPRHYAAYVRLAREMGYPEDQILTFETGQALEMDAEGVRHCKETIPHGSVLVDGISTGGVSDVVLRDRKHLSQGGTVIVTLGLERDTGEIVSGPDLLSRGFLHPEDSSELFEEAAERVRQAIEELDEDEFFDLDTLRVTIHDTVARFLRKRTNRHPVVIPVVMEV
ncbi:predicted hydrolase of the metallo-beta-lactamase superfamily [Chthonomonas calidirosea]|uniref:ribonuclease J n=1 Tax=Chthonomonas calidirosea TaxID=454171 RepID=UPI0006DD4DD4|nr:ribonuclease J [Chthonomonas calidirosea]CEK18394.1 predicted hydrolase of the metallo-beta-lactamase superfamily [Chthonomonas calidirosea]